MIQIKMASSFKKRNKHWIYVFMKLTLKVMTKMKMTNNKKIYKVIKIIK